MNKPRVLVVHPRLVAYGGGSGVAAWALQALRERCELSLATLEAAPVARLNDAWGTRLRDGDFRVLPLPRHYRLLRGLHPHGGALLEVSLLMRFAQDLDRHQRYDVLLSTKDEMDFGRRGICYVHLPWAYGPGAGVPSVAARVYRRLCQRAGRASDGGLRRNLMLANSAFTADRIRRLHGVESTVVYPPVAVEALDVPWPRRERAVVAVGRLHGCKRWHTAVEIVDELRRRGHALGLTLLGHVDDPVYQGALERLAATRPWFRIRIGLGRAEMCAEPARHRYGLHAMVDEHFGMGPAEIQRAGCLLFTHRSGGPLEITGGEPALLWGDVREAADRLERVLVDEALERRLRAEVAARRPMFSAEAFGSALVAAVDRFAQEGR